MKKLYLYGMLVAAIVIMAAVYLFTSGGGTANLASFKNLPVPQSLVSQLSISDSESAAIGMGLARITSEKVTAPSLMLNGKPELLYISANFCPFCALNRWGLVIALLRFGNLTGLKYMTSSHTDIWPDTPTFTFVNATYSSSYISFVVKETDASQDLTSSESAIISAFDTRGSIPFMDFANQSVQIGPNYSDLSILANKNWTYIASQLHNESSVIAKVLIGSANIFTAEICKMNGNVPESVCGQSYVQNIENQLQ